MDEQVTTPDTSSVAPADLRYATGESRLIAVLYKKVEELDKEVHALKTQKILDETKIPIEILERSGLLPPEPAKLRRGKGARPLLRSEIEEAIKQSPFCTDQARYLGVSVACYRKYASQLGLYHPQPHHKGSKKPFGPEKGRRPLSKILAGEFNGDRLVTDAKVRRKLIQAGWPEECSVCGYKGKPFGQQRVPLLLDHIDGDRNNFKKENLRLLCWNHMIECGRGYLKRGIRYFDPDWSADGK